MIQMLLKASDLWPLVSSVQLFCHNFLISAKLSINVFFPFYQSTFLNLQILTFTRIKELNQYFYQNILFYISICTFTQVQQYMNTFATSGQGDINTLRPWMPRWTRKPIELLLGSFSFNLQPAPAVCSVGSGGMWKEERERERQRHVMSGPGPLLLLATNVGTCTPTLLPSNTHTHSPTRHIAAPQHNNRRKEGLKGTVLPAGTSWVSPPLTLLFLLQHPPSATPSCLCLPWLRFRSLVRLHLSLLSAWNGQCFSQTEALFTTFPFSMPRTHTYTDSLP